MGHMEKYKSKEDENIIRVCYTSIIFDIFRCNVFTCLIRDVLLLISTDFSIISAWILTLQKLRRSFVKYLCNDECDISVAYIVVEILMKVSS